MLLLHCCIRAKHLGWDWHSACTAESNSCNCCYALFFVCWPSMLLQCSLRADSQAAPGRSGAQEVMPGNLQLRGTISLGPPSLGHTNPAQLPFESDLFRLDRPCNRVAGGVSGELSTSLLGPAWLTCSALSGRLMDAFWFRFVLAGEPDTLSEAAAAD